LTGIRAPIIEEDVWQVFLKMISLFDGKEGYWCLFNVDNYFGAIAVIKKEKLSSIVDLW
jgi:hypothetical protein